MPTIKAAVNLDHGRVADSSDKIAELGCHQLAVRSDRGGKHNKERRRCCFQMIWKVRAGIAVRSCATLRSGVPQANEAQPAAPWQVDASVTLGCFGGRKEGGREGSAATCWTIRLRGGLVAGADTSDLMPPFAARLDAFWMTQQESRHNCPSRARALHKRRL